MKNTLFSMQFLSVKTLFSHFLASTLWSSYMKTSIMTYGDSLSSSDHDRALYLKGLKDLRPLDPRVQDPWDPWDPRVPDPWPSKGLGPLKGPSVLGS